MIINAQKHKGRLDRPGLVKTENPVLVGIGRRQPVAQRPKVRDQPIQIRHVRQFCPVPAEKHHQVCAKFDIGLGHFVPGHRDHRLYRAFDHRQGFILQAEHQGTIARPHRANRYCPSRRVNSAVTSSAVTLKPFHSGLNILAEGTS